LSTPAIAAASGCASAVTRTLHGNTGKTHTLIALGVAAVEAGHRVRYFTATDLVETLYRGLADNSVGRLINTLLRNDLHISSALVHSWRRRRPAVRGRAHPCVGARASLARRHPVVRRRSPDGGESGPPPP
jgi:IstB-like ATP binding protein